MLYSHAAQILMYPERLMLLSRLCPSFTQSTRSSTFG
jgi:hypothetical protein